MKFELKESMAKLEELNSALEIREKNLRQETQSSELVHQKLLIRENKIKLEAKRLENWSKEIKSKAEEVEY